ncbi:MAG: peptidylprolyl isomerase, partial [Dehalococcoidia bacterium]
MAYPRSVWRLVFLLPALVLVACAASNPTPWPTPTPRPPSAATPVSKPYTQYEEQFPMTIDATKQYIATMRTEKGDIVIELNAEKAPVTVNNFVELAR